MNIFNRIIDWVGTVGFVKLVARRKIKLEIRGYRLLKRSAESRRVNQLNQELTQLHLGVDERSLSINMFGKEVEHVEIATRQRLLAHLAGSRLNRGVLRSIASPGERIAIPIPGIWAEKLLQFGYPVDKFRSKLKFAIFVFLCFGRGLIRILWDFIGIRGISPADPHVNYVQFLNLEPNNLPKLNAHQRYDIVSWYLGWGGRVNGLREVRHTVPFQENRILDEGVALKYTRSTLPKLVGFRSKLKYALWGFHAILYTLWEMFNGRWACAVLLEEVAVSRRVELVDPKSLAVEYLFSNSELIVRPFWTYVAERLGSKITLYYYSANFAFRYKGVAPLYDIGFQSITWPRVLQFSEYHQSYTIAAVNSKVRVELVPPIYFSDSAAFLPKVVGPCIAVFDVTPVRMSFRAGLVPENDYRSLEIGVRYLEEIYDVLLSKGYKMMWKRKRSFNYRVHSSGYIKFADSFALRPGVVEVHSDIAAARVMKNCFASISMPFTSTGLLAKHENIPSIYYDPVGSLSKDDPAGLGIPLIVGAADLKRWVDELSCHSEDSTDEIK